MLNICCYILFHYASPKANEGSRKGSLETGLLEAGIEGHPAVLCDLTGVVTLSELQFQHLCRERL